MGNELDRQYKELLETIINFGVDKKDRTGMGTKSIFGYTIRHNMQKGFPILTTKKVAWKQVTSELLWFLTCQTNISFLHKHNNHIWDGDAYKNYLIEGEKLNKQTGGVPDYYTQKEFINQMKTDDEFAKKWGELGPIYGKQWRQWNSSNNKIDQIWDLVKNLKENPDSRRLMVSAWNVGELDQMVLPPCHYGFQVWTRELSLQERIKLGDFEFLEAVTDERCDLQNIPTRAISLMWNQRSVDTFLGLPFNISSYGLLLHLLANECGMIPDELIGNLGDTHLYLNHIEQAKEQIGRTSFDLPQLKTNIKIDGICCANPSDFILEDYEYHPTIKATINN